MTREHVRTIAHEAVAKGTPMAWFEQLYREAARDPSKVPWADLRPNPQLVAWCQETQVKGEGRSACVVGAGLGDDAEALCAIGFRVRAFDVSETAVKWAKERHPTTAVEYEVTNLFDAPRHYAPGFDFVFEAYTIQSMPLSLRAGALEALSGLVAPGGTLLMIARLRRDEAPPPGPPWPLAESELGALEHGSLRRISLQVYRESGDADVERFIAEYRREI